MAKPYAKVPGAMPQEVVHDTPAPMTEQGRNLLVRLQAGLPAAAHRNAVHGVHKLMDYQDGAYASLYLDRLERVARLDGAQDVGESALRKYSLFALLFHSVDKLLAKDVIDFRHGPRTLEGTSLATLFTRLRLMPTLQLRQP